MKRVIAGLLWITICASPILADQLVDDRGFPYPGAITDFKDLQVVIRLQSRALKEIPVDKVRTLEVTSNPSFTQAEALAEKKKYSDALQAYNKALAASRTEWMKQLVQARRMLAANQGGLVDQAVKDWLEICDATEASKSALGLIPSPGKSERLNRRAIQTLTSKAKQLGRNAKDNKPYLSAVLNLLLQLQEAQGDANDAAATKKQLAELTGGAPAATTPSTPSSPGTKPTAPLTANGQAFQAMQKMLDAGKADAVIDAIVKNFAGYNKTQLPAAYLTLGKAQLQKYQQDGKKDQALLCNAGLNLVWVYARYDGEPEVPEALYLAAQTAKLLGDTQGAEATLQLVARVYGDDGSNPWSQKAKAELEANKGGN